MGPIQKLSLLFAAVKITQLTLLAATPAQFDISSQLLLSQYHHEKSYLESWNTPLQPLNSILSNVSTLLLDRVVDKLVTWDAVYFADLFANEIQFEHQFVFCPLWWRLVQSIPVPQKFHFYGKLLAATLIANTCHFLAAVVLFHYTLLVFQNARIFSPNRMALASLALFILSPAGVFLTAPYSESIASFSSFLCLFLREKALLVQNGSLRFNSTLYVLSGALASLAYGFRANCLLLGLVYVHDLVVRPLQLRQIWPLFAGLVLGATFTFSQFANYWTICHGTQRGEWCSLKLPSLFTYAQAHYWNNGFLKYWRVANVPNFAFGAPTIGLSVFGMHYFRQVNPVDRITPILLVNIVFLVLLLGFWHVQIVTRIHTFLPVVYWVVAGLATQTSESENADSMQKLWPGYFVVWAAVQTCLFGAFLPPA